MNLKPLGVDQTQEALSNYTEMGQGIVEVLEITIHDATKVAIDWHSQHREIKRLREALQEGLSLMMIAADTLWRMHDGKALDVAPKAVASDLHDFRRHTRKEFGIKTHGEVLAEAMGHALEAGHTVRLRKCRE